MSLANRWFMRFVFRVMLIKRAYTLDEMRRMMNEAGWVDASIDASPIGFEASMKK